MSKKYKKGHKHKKHALHEPVEVASRPLGPFAGLAIEDQMAMVDLFKNLRGGDDSNLPAVSGGKIPQRSSVAEGAQTQAGILSAFATMPSEFPLELLDTLSYLAKVDPDLSYAVDNIVQLGNQPYRVYFNDSLTDTQQKGLMKDFKENSTGWYNTNEGVHSLLCDLFAQVALYGAISAEICPQWHTLDNIRVVLVRNREVRFKYNPVSDYYDPYQHVRNFFMVDEKADIMGLKKLNTNTYKYYAIRRFDDNPYAIPPYLASLDSIAIEKDMLQNLKKVVKKVGILGFLQVLINPPDRMPIRDPNNPTQMKAETENEYNQRCLDYLRTFVAPEVERGLGNGYILGLKGKHEFKMEDTLTNVQGARDLFQLNSELKMSGLKQDPIMFGRNYNTTETLGRVMLAKLGEQICNYQKLVGNFLGDCIKMFGQLRGYPVTYCDVEFEAPMIGDELKDAQAEDYKINNALVKRDAGIISQIDVAQELGYEKPDKAVPPVATIVAPTLPRQAPQPAGTPAKPAKPKAKPTKKKVADNSPSNPSPSTSTNNRGKRGYAKSQMANR